VFINGDHGHRRSREMTVQASSGQRDRSGARTPQ
jgi:hypothetical protein